MLKTKAELFKTTWLYKHLEKYYEVSFISDRIRNRFILLMLDGEICHAFNLSVHFKNSRELHPNSGALEFMNTLDFHYSRDLPGLGFKPGRNRKTKVRIENREFSIEAANTEKFIGKKFLNIKF